MKTSAILSSFLLSALVAARPMDKRALVTKTETVFETVVVYTTVWEDSEPATTVDAKPTSQPGLFFERPQPSQAEQKPTSQNTPPPVVNTPPPAAKPAAPAPTTSAAAPPPPPPAPAPEKPSTPVVQAPPPAPTTKEPAPAPPAPTTTQAAPSIPPLQQAAPAPAPSAPASNGGGQIYTGEMTIYNPAGQLGACGKNLNDDEFIVALGAPTMGPSTYNVMTGEATNPWCGKKIQITYEGKTAVGTIEDKCPGCAAGDIDLSPALWKQLTGMDPSLGGRFKASWTPL